MRILIILLTLSATLPLSALCQNIEKTVFDPADTSDGYYLALRPRSNNIKGVLILCTSFAPPESMLPETKLHNVAFANDLLTVFVSFKQKLYADTPTVDRMNAMLKHVARTYAVDTSKFALAGYDFAGNITLRYAQLTQEHPSQFVLQPKAVIAIGSPVDLFRLWAWCERQIKRNSPSAWDAKYLVDLMSRELGSIPDKKEQYLKLTPFNTAGEQTGNERFLNNIPVRLYYDVDLEWQLKERQNSIFDTFIPEGTELVSRLHSLGNGEAELITAKQPGYNSSGVRTTNALSIVNEVDCIHWIKNKLDIFDPHTWRPPYNLLTPSGWAEERFPIPIDFAPQIPYKGVEDVRFAPGWGELKSEQYWSYAYLWWLEGTQQLDAGLLQKHLQAYYEGLVGRNIKERNIAANKVVPTEVSIKKVKTAVDDVSTYEGTVGMLDYMAQKPITLNCLVHVKSCSSLDHTAVFIEISPRAFTHIVWKELNRINSSFACKP